MSIISQKTSLSESKMVSSYYDGGGLTFTKKLQKVRTVTYKGSLLAFDIMMNYLIFVLLKKSLKKIVINVIFMSN